MSGLEDASSEELQRVFESVTRALDQAGVPWFDTLDRPDHGAAFVEIDDLDDGRGVYLFWSPGRSDSAAAMAAFNAGEWDDPELDRVAATEQQGMDRLARVLREAGVLTREKDDEMNPYTLEVVRVL